MAKNIYESFIPKHEEIAEDFIKYIHSNRNQKSGCLEDVFFHLTKFSIDGNAQL